MKIKTEFTADNLTIFGGYSNIFSFLVKSNIFKKLDKFISVKKKKKIYEKLDYIKIFMTMLIFGFKNMNQICLLNRDKFILNLLDLGKFPHASNISRFLKKFSYKHCQQIVDVKRELFKKFHKKAFNLKRMTIDIDTTVLNLCGYQEGAEKGYNDVKRGNRSYHPILVTNIVSDSKKLVYFYRKRGNAENYIKEQKYDLNIGKLNTDSFLANQAIFQFTILCYNMLVWFKNIFIGKSELKTTIRTFRERFLLIPAKLIKRSRQFILKLPRDFIYKEKMKSIELQLA